MKILKKNKGALILYIVILVCSLILMNDVKRSESINNNYAMIETK